MKAIILRLSSSKKLVKLTKERPMVNKYGSIKSAIRPVQLLPARANGLSLSFWEHFQARKNLLLGRYKHERMGRGHQAASKRKSKPTLTNSHI